MRTFLGQVSLSAVAAAFAFIVALVGSRVTASRLGTRTVVAALLLFGFGLVAAATLVPTNAALEGTVSDGTCDVSRVGLAPVNQYISVTGVSLNVLLFMPLGVAVGLLPRTRATALAAVAAISLTFVVEAIQLTVTVLGRGCQTADMVDNLLGVALGIVVGILLRPLVGLLPSSPA